MSPNLGPVPDNSTLVYYAVLTIVPSALPNITDKLSSIVLDEPPHTYQALLTEHDEFIERLYPLAELIN